VANGDERGSSGVLGGFVVGGTGGGLFGGGRSDAEKSFKRARKILQYTSAAVASAPPRAYEIPEAIRAARASRSVGTFRFPDPTATHALPTTPGAPPSQSTAPRATAGVDRFFDDLGYAIQLADQIAAWVRQRKKPRAAAPAAPAGGGGNLDWLAEFLAVYPTSSGVGNVATLGFEPGYVPGRVRNLNVAGGGLMPSGNTWEALATAGVGLVNQVLGSIYGPQAMPGGARIPGTGINGDMVPYGGVPTATRTMGGRAPAIIAVNGRAFRSLGTPIAWSGDLSAVKRLRRAARRIGRVLPHRRGGGRFR